METETNQADVLLRHVPDQRQAVGIVCRAGSAGYDFPRALYVTPDELQAIVQAAYDQHGITAQLWHSEPPRCNGTSHCIAEHHHSGCAWALARQGVPA